MAIKIIQSLQSSYKTLIDHYEPITKVIIEKLKSIANPKDKIKYLKSEEIKYLIDVTMNPNLMASSGIVTTANPHKAGLDRWIELKIKEIENDNLSIEKKIFTSYVWQGNPDKELPELYNLMINKYKLIAPETTFEQFKAVFTGQPIESIEPIKWIVAKNLNAYFIMQLIIIKKLSKAANNNVWEIAKNCFTNGRNFGQLVDLYNNSKIGKPKNCNIIDNLLNTL